MLENILFTVRKNQEFKTFCHDDKKKKLNVEKKKERDVVGKLELRNKKKMCNKSFYPISFLWKEKWRSGQKVVKCIYLFSLFLYIYWESVGCVFGC